MSELCSFSTRIVFHSKGALVLVGLVQGHLSALGPLGLAVWLSAGRVRAKAVLAYVLIPASCESATIFIVVTAYFLL